MICAISINLLQLRFWDQMQCTVETLVTYCTFWFWMILVSCLKQKDTVPTCWTCLAVVPGSTQRPRVRQGFVLGRIAHPEETPWKDLELIVNMMWRTPLRVSTQWCNEQVTTHLSGIWNGSVRRGFPMFAYIPWGIVPSTGTSFLGVAWYVLIIWHYIYYMININVCKSTTSLSVVNIVAALVWYESVSHWS